MQEIRCESCQRLIAKRDFDGTLHIKRGKREPEILTKLGSGGRLMIVCPEKIERHNLKQPIMCGNSTTITDAGVACLE